jgi:hypothetical protein
MMVEISRQQLRGDVFRNRTGDWPYEPPTHDFVPENPQTRATPAPGQPNGPWWFLRPSSDFPFLQYNPRTATLTRTHPVG